ncbi:hypothetical protein [Paraburkholderia sp. BR10936]
MHPRTRAVVTALATFGASPCVILGIVKGTTRILAHIHRANDLKVLKGQLAAILRDALPANSPASAFIATEKYIGDTDDGPVQAVMIETLRTILRELHVSLQAECMNRMSAVLSYDGYHLPDESNGFYFEFGEGEIAALTKWAEAYETRFWGRNGVLPMAIRDGINNEDPMDAIARLYRNDFPPLR